MAIATQYSVLKPSEVKNGVIFKASGTCSTNYKITEFTIRIGSTSVYSASSSECFEYKYPCSIKAGAKYDISIEIPISVFNPIGDHYYYYGGVSKRVSSTFSKTATLDIGTSLSKEFEISRETIPLKYIPFLSSSASNCSDGFELKDGFDYYVRRLEFLPDSGILRTTLRKEDLKTLTWEKDASYFIYGKDSRRDWTHSFEGSGAGDEYMESNGFLQNSYYRVMPIMSPKTTDCLIEPEITNLEKEYPTLSKQGYVFATGQNPFYGNISFSNLWPEKIWGIPEPKAKIEIHYSTSKRTVIQEVVLDYEEDIVQMEPDFYSLIGDDTTFKIRISILLDRNIITTYDFSKSFILADPSFSGRVYPVENNREYKYYGENVVNKNLNIYFKEWDLDTLNSTVFYIREYYVEDGQRKESSAQLQPKKYSLNSTGAPVIFYTLQDDRTTILNITNQNEKGVSGRTSNITIYRFETPKTATPVISSVVEFFNEEYWTPTFSYPAGVLEIKNSTAEPGLDFWSKALKSYCADDAVYRFKIYHKDDKIYPVKELEDYHTTRPTIEGQNIYFNYSTSYQSLFWELSKYVVQDCTEIECEVCLDSIFGLLSLGSARVPILATKQSTFSKTELNCLWYLYREKDEGQFNRVTAPEEITDDSEIGFYLNIDTYNEYSTLLTIYYRKGESQQDLNLASWEPFGNRTIQLFETGSNSEPRTEHFVLSFPMPAITKYRFAEFKASFVDITGETQTVNLGSTRLIQTKNADLSIVSALYDSKEQKVNLSYLLNNSSFITDYPLGECKTELTFKYKEHQETNWTEFETQTFVWGYEKGNFPAGRHEEIITLPNNDWGFLDLAIDIKETYSFKKASNEVGQQTYKKDEISKESVYNFIPTVSYRKNFVGLNCTETTDEMISNLLVAINQINSKNKIQYFSQDQELPYCEVINFSIDCGNW